jgi:hypothetical protein
MKMQAKNESTYRRQINCKSYNDGGRGAKTQTAGKKGGKRVVSVYSRELQ